MSIGIIILMQPDGAEENPYLRETKRNVFISGQVSTDVNMSNSDCCQMRLSKNLKNSIPYITNI